MKIFSQLILAVSASFLITSPSSAEALAPEEDTPKVVAPHVSKAVSPVADNSGLKHIDKAALQAVISKTAKDLLIPGAVVVLQTPQGDFAVDYGTTQLGATTTPNGQTHFRIASNTKTMTAAIIMQLAQEGKLKLSDPVSKYVDGVPNGDKLTIAQLLEMRSGLYNYTESPQIADSLDNDPKKVWTPAELLSIAFKQPVTAQPGTTFAYDNTNYALLGVIIEKVDGKPLSTSMQNRLFGPLGMKNTFLPAAASSTMPDPFSHGYLYGSSSVALAGTPDYSPELKAAAKAGTIQPKDYTDVNHSFAAAAGGVVSTADDLAVWIRALTTGRILDAKYQRLWLDSPQVEDPSNPEGTRYGYGIAQMHWGPNSYYYHGGETPGFNSFIGYDPKNQVTLIVWTNLTVDLLQTVTANTLMLKVLDQIYAVSPLPASAAGTSARP